ncbi:hypothetical protein XENOCAPTIV_015117, partial [Xenoophorus captivus]
PVLSWQRRQPVPAAPCVDSVPQLIEYECIFHDRPLGGRGKRSVNRSEPVLSEQQKCYGKRNLCLLHFVCCVGAECACVGVQKDIKICSHSATLHAVVYLKCSTSQM